MSSLTPTIEHWLLLTTLLFSIGLYGILVRRSAIAILLCIEILLNSVILNFLIFNRFVFPYSVDGEIMTLFILAVGAAEVVVALAIFLAVNKEKKSLDVTKMDDLKY